MNTAVRIEQCARKGYLRSEWRTLDPTVGIAGGFWKRWRPRVLVTGDLHAAADVRLDFTSLPFADATFDAAVFDPRYKLSGTTKGEQVDVQYGVTTGYVPVGIIHGDMTAGLSEVIRVFNRTGFVIAKCQDQVASGRKHWQTHLLTETAAKHGLDLIDKILVPSKRKQPEGRAQWHFESPGSELLVFGTQRANRKRQRGEL